MSRFPTALVAVWICVACSVPALGAAPADPAATALGEILTTAKRIPNRTGWFEVLRLPNDVYALWEPGHTERVNAFFVAGTTHHLLYDTGMGIASIRGALDDLQREEGLAELPLLVVNSHNHLDHNGGNYEFPMIHTADDAWAKRRLSLGVPAGAFTTYWDQLVDHPGVQPPSGFDPARHAIPPYPLEQVRFLDEGDVVDLGNRRLRVIRTYSHTPDGIVLHDPENGLFFGGDTFYGANYLVADFAMLAVDLERVQHLAVKWHYSSHGPQLVAAMQHGTHLAVVRRMLAGEGEAGDETFAGATLPLRSLEGVRVTIAPELLLY